MPDSENVVNDRVTDSPDTSREVLSAREVTVWEAALAAARADPGAARAAAPERVPAEDRANAGAIVSRAHRAEKATNRPPDATRPRRWTPDSADTAE